MLGFFKWFKSGTRMKRWMFVILLGIILLCYGIATIMNMTEISILNLIITIILSVIGFLLVIVGIIYSQKRVLELLIENTDDRISEEKKDVNVNSLIFNKRIYSEGPKIVAIGGGTGLNAVLKGIKEYTNNLTAIVEMSGASPIENIKNSMIALADDEEIMRNLLNLKIQDDMDFTHLLVSAMEEIDGEGAKAIEDISKVLNIKGKILPVTLDSMNVNAELDDGTVIEDKSKIAETAMDKVSKINRVYVAPSNIRPAPGVIEAIQDADAIIIGPGNIYTEIIPNLLIKNISKTIKESRAIKVYISNIMTKAGETDDLSISEHLQAIFEHANNKVADYCMYDTGEVMPEMVMMYNKKGSYLIEQDISKIRELGVKTIAKDFALVEDGKIRHNPVEVADAVIELICEDLRFRDMQNDPQFVRMNTKLKQNAEERKVKQKEKKKNKKEENKKARRMMDKRRSKFSAKYDERIRSIKTSEIKRQKKIQNLEKK